MMGYKLAFGRRTKTDGKHFKMKIDFLAALLLFFRLFIPEEWTRENFRTVINNFESKCIPNIRKISMKELFSLFGIVFFISVARLSGGRRQYWKDEVAIERKVIEFGSIMLHNPFEIICACATHFFCQDDGVKSDFDKLLPLQEAAIATFSAGATAGPVLTFDESMSAWLGKDFPGRRNIPQNFIPLDRSSSVSPNPKLLWCPDLRFVKTKE